MTRKIMKIIFTDNPHTFQKPVWFGQIKDYLNLLNIIFFGNAFTLTSEVNHLAIWKEY
jgi:hypothetical protein